MSFLKKVKNFGKKVIDFEKSHTKNLLSEIKHDPLTLLHPDPLTTKAWNTVTGQHDRNLVNQLGGATSQDYKNAQAQGVDIGPGKTLQDVAGMIAGAYGGGALGSAAGTFFAPASGAVGTAATTAGRLGAASLANQPVPVPDQGGLAQAAAAPPNPDAGLPMPSYFNGVRNYDFNITDPYSYGQYGGEHQFISNPNPVQQAARGGRAMPSKTPAQARLMRAVAHGWKMPGGGGPPVSVAKEFEHADEARGKYASGGLAQVAGMAPPPQVGADPNAHGLPGSITRMLWDKYGITDPTRTPWDNSTPQMIADAQPAPNVPVAAPQPQPAPPSGSNPVPPYANSAPSPYSARLAAHQARVANILSGIRGKALGGPVRMAVGGPVPMPGSYGGEAIPMSGAGPAPGSNPFMAAPVRAPMAPPPSTPQPGGLSPFARPQTVAPALDMTGDIRHVLPVTSQSAPPPSPVQQMAMQGQVPPNMQGLLQKMRMMQRPGVPQGRIGTGDQQGGLARAMQVQTGRPPISRRMAFPGTR